MKKSFLFLTMLLMLLTGCSTKSEQNVTTNKKEQILKPRKQIVIQKEILTELPFSPVTKKLSDSYAPFEAVPLVTGDYLINVPQYVIIKKKNESKYIETNNFLQLKKEGYAIYNKEIYSGAIIINENENDLKLVNNQWASYSNKQLNHNELQVSPDTIILLNKDDKKLIMQKLPTKKIINELTIENGIFPGEWRTTLYPAPNANYLGHISFTLTDGDTPYSIRTKDLKTSKIYNIPFVVVPYSDDLEVYGTVADKNDIIWVAYNIKSDSLKAEQYSHSYLQAYHYNPEKDEFVMIDKKELPGENNYTIFPSDDGIGVIWITEEQKNPQLEQWHYYFNETSASIVIK